ncbi:MAG: acetyl-CoA acetyltransferase, partial [Proteobacteria bacterium]|nr:acetyl-CoA acetyltransferase [Pseudomonadota bacterium]
LVMPSVVYPLFANAYRQAQGLSLDENLLQIGKFCEKYAKVAVDNEYAWFRDGKNADLISTVTPDNRMITYPYTKFMNAIMNVDQAAALIVMSDEKADSLGIPQEKRVYLIGCGDASDKWLVSNRVNYHSAPGLEIAFSNAFRQAEVDKSEINQWDFYNCFPVPAQVAVQTLGLPDSVVPTVVGGLPYFGGPGNNYTLHAICGMVERLRENPEQKGLVQALSWFMSKYSVGIYSGIRPEKFQRRDPAEYMYEVDELYPDVVVLTGAGGTFEIETYTVSVNREGEPESAVVIARNENRERLFALNVDDRALMTSMTQEEPIGKNVRISYDESTGMHRFADIF